MHHTRPIVSPLLVEAFGVLQADPSPFVEWLHRTRPVGWVRRRDLGLSLPSKPDVDVIAMRIRDDTCDIEIQTRRCRMVSDRDVVSIVAGLHPELLAGALVGKVLSTVASTTFLVDARNVILKAVVLDSPPRLVLMVRAPAVPLCPTAPDHPEVEGETGKSASIGAIGSDRSVKASRRTEHSHGSFPAFDRELCDLQ